MIIDKNDSGIDKRRSMTFRGIAVRVLDKFERRGLFLPKEYILKIKERDSMKIFDCKVSRKDYFETKVGENYEIHIPVSRVYDENRNYVGEIVLS